MVDRVRARLTELIDEMEPVVRAAFADSIATIKSDAILSLVVEALERRDIAAAIEAINIERPAFAPLERALRQGFLAEARLERFLTCNVTLEAYGLREGMIVRRHSETGRYSAQNGLYSIEEWGLAADRSSMSVSLSEFDPTIARDWNPETDEMPFVLEPTEE